MRCARVMVLLRALSQPVGSDRIAYSSTVLVLESYSSTTLGELVLAIPGTRLVLVLEGQCTWYSVKKSAEYTSTFGFR